MLPTSFLRGLSIVSLLNRSRRRWLSFWDLIKPWSSYRAASLAVKPSSFAISTTELATAPTATASSPASPNTLQRWFARTLRRKPPRNPVWKPSSRWWTTAMWCPPGTLSMWIWRTWSLPMFFSLGTIRLRRRKRLKRGLRRDSRAGRTGGSFLSSGFKFWIESQYWIRSCLRFWLWWILISKTLVQV